MNKSPNFQFIESIHTQLPIEIQKKKFTHWLILITILLSLAWAWDGAEMNQLPLLWIDRGNMLEYMSEFFPPDFHHWKDYVYEMMITIKLALWGTALAILFSVPFAFMCSENISPQWIVQPTRRLMDAFRAINEIVFAMLFVVAVGLGPFAGVMAIFIHTTGILAKLFSEAVEAIEEAPVEGIRATGANKLEEIIYGVIPQVMPLWVSYTLYRFESNVRSATILGIVGAGGIGMLLYESIRGFQYAQTCSIMLLIIATVVVLDFLSQCLRKHFI